MNQDASNTLKTRLCYYYLKNIDKLRVYNEYLNGKINRDQLYDQVPKQLLNTVLNNTMSNKNINDVFKQIDFLIKDMYNNEIDIIVGGPPCQAYSLAGRAKQRRDTLARENGEDKKDDERKYLYKLYCDFLVKYNPKFFVFENVPGLISSDGGKHFKDLQNLFKNSGYEIDWKILNARDFGVPQNRKRIIILGWKKGTDFKFPEFNKVEPYWDISDVLSDLPSLQAGENSKIYKSSTSSVFVSENLREENDVLTWHVARSNSQRDREIYKLVISTWDKEKQRFHYANLPENLRTHKNTKDFTDRFKMVVSDVPYSHTILAHIAKDGHYYIHPDYEQARSLTVREAARIQSFPDNYFFEGSRTSAYTQIGNAVPPIMAEAIAKYIKKIINKKGE
jgi:DNA (cytosine-5)-methyltransferase 1